MNGRRLRREADYRFVPQDHSGTGIMAAIAPPKRVVDALTLSDEHAEPAHDLHTTLAYLGKVGEHSRGQLRDLPEVMNAWAEGQRPLRMKVGGAGHFLPSEEGGPHPLIALVSAPGLHRVQASLVDHLRRYRYNPRDDHGFTGHITLGYSRDHVRFLPKVEPHEWTARSVWTAIGEGRREHRFGA